MQPAVADRRFSPRFLVLTGMIALAIGVRLLIHFVPGVLPWNFTPVEALGLFGGAYFSSRRDAFLVPLAAMALSDLVIGLHPLIPVVYACIAGSVLLGFGLARRPGALRVVLAGIASASGFYLITNFAVWATSTMYPHSATGLIACYVAGLPFYPATLAGTLVWSGVLFGGYALLERRWPALAAATQAT